MLLDVTKLVHIQNPEVADFWGPRSKALIQGQSHQVQGVARPSAGRPVRVGIDTPRLSGRVEGSYQESRTIVQAWVHKAGISTPGSLRV